MDPTVELLDNSRAQLDDGPERELDPKSSPTLKAIEGKSLPPSLL
jgi:hypothetical protein